MAVLNSFYRKGDINGFLEAWQREADAQAARWIERELCKLMRRDGPPPFDGHQPPIAYNRRTSQPLLEHVRVSVRRFDIKPGGARR